MVRRIILLAIAALCLAHLAAASEVKTVDLKPYVGYSPFDVIKADWLIPRGNHVFDGVPWKIDGVILLYGKNAVQKTNAARTIVDIPIGEAFERLHLLAAAQQTSSDKTVIAKIHLNYADGTKANLNVQFGNHVRYYMRNWHHEDKPINNKTVHEAWHALFEPSSNHDQYLRLFHVLFANPHPGKEVRSITFESTKETAALMIAAMSIGPADATPLPNEVLGKGIFPDLRKRTGALETGEGYVYSNEGKPLEGALIRIIAARNYESGELNETPPAVEAKTDSKGHFALTGLPDDSAYRLLIVAEGFGPFVYHGLDAKSDAIQVRMEPATNHIEAFFARARVVGPDDKPVAYAQIERDGIGYSGTTSWGYAQDLPEYVISDTNGEFVLSRKQEFDRVQVKVTSRGLAPYKDWIPVTNTTTVIQLGVGATIRGRVLDLKGAPLSNVRLGIEGADRNSEVYAGSYFTAAHNDGTFVFEHVIPRIKWNLFGMIDSFQKFGALGARSITSAPHGETNDLGDLQVTPGLHLSGRVKTRRGEPMPKNLKLLLGIETGGGGIAATVGTNGQFKFEGLYPAQITLWLNSETWRLSPLNRSTSLWNQWEMIGMFEKNKDDLVVEIEKGKREYVYENDNGSLPNSDEPQSKEIGGVENLQGIAIVISGSIVDDKTGKPIANCKIVPGYKGTAAAWGYPVGQPKKNLVEKLLQPLQKKQPNWWERPFWMPARAEKTTNGTFSVPFVPLQSSPVLRVEANGYQPVVTEAMQFSTNIVIRMTTGDGPSGTVLMPDGKPAENAHILYATAGEQNGLDGRRLNLYGNDKQHSKTTGADGKFSFAARNQGTKLYATHEVGYGEVSVRDKDSTVEVQLKPWAWLTGTLQNSNGTPAVGVQLGLTLYDGTTWDSTQPLLHYSRRVKTDSKGFFLFSNVPPRRVQVERIVPMGRGGGWSSVLQTWMDVEPGVTNDLGIVTYDKPPAKSVLEQIKAKLDLK